jgi:integrase
MAARPLTPEQRLLKETRELIAYARRELPDTVREDGILHELAATPYSLRHAYASLLVHEGRSVIEVAAQLGHSPSVCLDTYGHVIAELTGARRVKAKTAIERARKATAGKSAGSTLAPQVTGGGAE